MTKCQTNLKRLKSVTSIINSSYVVLEDQLSTDMVCYFMQCYLFLRQFASTFGQINVCLAAHNVRISSANTLPTEMQYVFCNETVTRKAYMLKAVCQTYIIHGQLIDANNCVETFMHFHVEQFFRCVCQWACPDRDFQRLPVNSSHGQLVTGAFSSQSHLVTRSSCHTVISSQRRYTRRSSWVNSSHDFRRF